jgi:hypothetical protein
VRDLHDAARMLDAPLVISDDDAELVSELGHVLILSPAGGPRLRRATSRYEGRA